MSVLITGPTSGLGRELALELARRPEPGPPDLILVGRPGARLDAITADVRSRGASAAPVPCDLGDLASVRAAAETVRDLLARGVVSPLKALVANAGMYSMDLSATTADGYERTFAINHLAHAQLIGDLADVLTPPARIVLLGSNTYRGDLPRRMIGVPGPEWRDPLELARPVTGKGARGLRASGVAYATTKLAVMYYAHELQHHVADGINVAVFEPGWMPGTGLSREASPRLQRLSRALTRLPGTSTPEKAAPALASLVLDDRWADLGNGDFVVLDKRVDLLPHGRNPERERRLWDATSDLLARARPGS